MLYKEFSESKKGRLKSSTLPFEPLRVNSARVRVVSDGSDMRMTGEGCVVYWMSRDQRAEDNHALLCAFDVADHLKVPVRVVFNLVPKFLEATLRQYHFMIEGLKEVEADLRKKSIPFHLTFGDPKHSIPDFLTSVNAAAVITDFSPLRVPKLWVSQVAEILSTSASQRIPMFQVDAHNIVPVWEASDKLEYSARTIRGKINEKLPRFLVNFPPLPDNSAKIDTPPIDWEMALNSLEINRNIGPVSWLLPGSKAALETLDLFLSVKIKDYDKRNDPNETCSSNLSPYLHFGQISAQRVALSTINYVRSNPKFASNKDSFIEELVVRRELADNFCNYNPKYDSLEGCYDWAKETLRIHDSDKREYIYSLDQLEKSKTHDDLWNAAQLQMVNEGKMHGFLRMYWAKKILEWTPNSSNALSIAIYLNDKYELDGRDPNGYVGCMWSIGGIHDQGWGERAIFGKIRFMNYQGCQRKFDVSKFVRKYDPKQPKLGGGISSIFSSIKKTK